MHLLLKAEWKRRPIGLAELGSGLVEKGIQECLMGKEVSGRPDKGAIHKKTRSPRGPRGQK